MKQGSSNPPLEGENTRPPGLLSVEEAIDAIGQTIAPPADREEVTLADALGRYLSEDVISPIDVPPYANSAMDGYAVRGEELPQSGEATLQLIGKSFAGIPFPGRVGTGEAVRIMTGAKMPAGADTVVMQEQVTLSGDRITLGDTHRPGENVRHPGEDIRADKAVVARGKRVGAAELGLLASLGIERVTLYRKVRVATFSTGDELRSLGEPLDEGQIYDSNRYTLRGLLADYPVEHLDMGIIPDKPERIEQAFGEAAARADVVITSGGVSVGEADFIKAMLAKLGEVNFWRIAMKPGKPLAFGKLGKATFFGLPGNPVSVMATFRQIVAPNLHRLCGANAYTPLRLRLRTVERLKKRPGRTDFQRGILEYGPDGQLQVRSTGHQGSHVLSSMSIGNCFIILPAAAGGVEAGEMVEVEPFRPYL